MTTFKAIKMENYKDEPLQFVGVYVLRWRSEWGEPSMGFVESDEPDQSARIAELEHMLERICANPMVQDTIEADPRTNYLIRDARKLLKGNQS